MEVEYCHFGVTSLVVGVAQHSVSATATELMSTRVNGGNSLTCRRVRIPSSLPVPDPVVTVRSEGWSSFLSITSISAYFTTGSSTATHIVHSGHHWSQNSRQYSPCCHAGPPKCCFVPLARPGCRHGKVDCRENHREAAKTRVGTWVREASVVSYVMRGVHTLRLWSLPRL